MKKSLLCVLLFGILLSLNIRSYAQVVISNDNSDPHPSAMLEVKSGNKGLLLPQVHLVSITSPDPVQNPAVGLVVQNLEVSNPALQTVVPGLYAWDGTLWRQLSFPRGIGMSSLLVWNGTQYISLPAGLPGQFLTVNSDATLSWTYGGGTGHSPSVITANPFEIAQYQFKCGGNVVSDGGAVVTQRGICYSTTPNPTYASSKIFGGVGTGLFTVVVSGLTANTLYYLKAFAINSYDTVYGDQVTVQTLPVSIPTVTTNEPSNINQSSLTIGGNVISDGGTSVYFRGVCYDTVPIPTLDDPRTIDGSGTGPFISNITGLLVGKTYYFRAYAWNNKGVAYGEQKVVSTACTSTLPVSVTIHATATTLCAGTSVTISAVPANGGTAPQFQWILNNENAGINGLQFTYAPSDGDHIYCVLTSGLTCTTSNPDTSETIVFSVNPLLQPSISILASSDTLCSGTPVTLMATPYNGGTNPTYQWKVNGSGVGGNNPVFSYTPANNDSVVCLMTSNANCLITPQAISNKIRLTVNQPVQVSCNITTNTNIVCPGVPVTYTATVLNGGQNPVYHWKVNNISQGNNSPVYTYTPVNGDIVTCSITPDQECTINNVVNSNEITMTVIAPSLPSITIASSAVSVCAGGTVLFSATATNLGASTGYQWYVNNQVAGSNSPGFSYTPSNGDTVSCRLTTQVQCLGQVVVNSNIIPIEVLPVNPVSISISASQNPVCSQNLVTFNAISINGGANPVYNWKVNGVTVGLNAPQFSFLPANNDQISCNLLSDVACVSQNPAISNTIVMSVLPLIQMTVIVNASQNPVCSGTAVTFSAVAPNAGSAPEYQWFRNNLPFGGNSASVTFEPDNNDHIKCRVQSSEMCITQNPVTSEDYIMTVNPVLPLGITISADFNPVCGNTPVNFTATTTNAGINPVYQWKINGANVGANSPVFTHSPLNNDVVQCFVSNTESCISGSPAGSNMLTLQVLQPLPVSVTIAPSANSVCSGTIVTMTATPVNGGLTPTYIWKKNGVVQPGNSNQFNFIPVQNDLISCELNSSESCVVSNNVTSNLVRMHVINPVTALITITSSSDSLCQGTPVTITANVINGGSNPLFQWMVNGQTNGANQPSLTYVPSNNDQVSCILTSNATCVSNSPVTSNEIVVHVRMPLPVEVTISPDLNPICDQTQVHFTAVATNGGANPIYQWKVNGLNQGGNSSLFSFLPAANDVVTCTLNSALSCVSGNPALSNQVMISITERKLLGVSITPSSNSLCEGSAVNIDATTVNAGANAVFTWFVNGVIQTTSGNQLSYFPADNDEILCEVTSGELCLTGNPALSNVLMMDVMPLVTPSITIAASNLVVCSGTQVSFAATVQNAGASPLYSWKINGSASGVNAPAFSYTPSNGDVITCELTSSLNCLTAVPVVSNVVAMTVNPVLPVAVTVVASQNPVCESASVTMTAITQNAGLNPQFAWFKNGVLVEAVTGPAYQFTPANNDVVHCTLTSGEPCASSSTVTSNQVVVQVMNTLPVSISLSASVNPSCAGETVEFMAHPINGGSMPEVQWMVNSLPVGNGGITYSYIPANNDLITCVLTSNAGCATGSPATATPLTIIVNPLIQPGLTIEVSNDTVCEGTQVQFSAFAVNGGNNPQYIWKINGNSGGGNSPSFSYIPSHGDIITCEMTSSMSCIPAVPVVSNSVSMVVNPIVPVAVTIVPSENPLCASKTITISAIAQNAGQNPQFTWFKNGIQLPDASGPALQYIPANNDIIHCELFSGASCPSSGSVMSNQVTIQVIDNLPVGISVAASVNPVCAGTNVVFTASPTNGGANPVIQWKINNLPAVGGNLNFSYVPSNNDQITCVLTSSEGCTTGSPATSLPVNMSVIPLVQPSISIVSTHDTVCMGSQVSFSTTVTNGGSNPQFVWKVNGIANGANTATFSYTPSNGDVVTCELTSSLNCVQTSPAVSNVLTVTVTPIAQVSITLVASENPVCETQSVTITAFTQNAGQNPQYAWFKNGLLISEVTGPVFQYIPVNNDIVYCALHSGHPCASSDNVNSNQIQIQVMGTLPVSVSISSSVNPACAGTPVTFTASSANGGATPAFQWMVNSQPVGNGGLTYTYIPTDQDQVSCSLTSNATCASGNPAISETVVMSVVPLMVPSILIDATSDTVCSGTMVTFSSVVFNSGANPVYQWKVNGLQVGTNAPAYSYIPANADHITCELTSSLPCLTSGMVISNELRMEVVPVLSVSVTVSASQTQICSGTEVTLNAVTINGGSNPVFTWYKNGSIISGFTGPVISLVPQNNDQIYCVVDGSYQCSASNPAISNTVVFKVTPVVPALISVVTSASQVCAGTIVEFSADIENGGTSPSYQWLVNNIPQGMNSPAFNYVPSDGDKISCVLNSVAACTSNNPDTSNIITMQVNPILPVNVTVTPSSNPVCNQSSVNFTTVVTNGGNSPSYQWFVNGNLVGTGTPSFNYFPGNNDNVHCVVNSSVTCAGANPAGSNIVNMQILPLLPASVSISATSNPACQGAPVTFSAVAVNGGANPEFHWKVNGNDAGTSTPVFIYSPLNTDKVWCEFVSSENCVIGNPAVSDTITMNILPVSDVQVTISTAQNIVCAGTTVTFTADVQNGGPDAIYQWKVNGNPQGNNQTSFSFVPVNGDVVSCTVTSGLLCSLNPVVTSNSIALTVNQPLQPSITISASQTSCCENTQVTINAIVQNGGAAPIYSWTVNGISAAGSGPSFTFTPVQNDVVGCMLTSSLSCVVQSGVQSNPVTITVNPVLTAGVQINASATTVCAGTTVTYTAQVVNGGTSPVLTWTVNGTPTNIHGATFTHIPVNGDQISCTMQSSYPCIQNPLVNAEPVTMVVNPVTPAAVTIAATANPVCAGTIVTFMAIPINGGTAPAFEWKVNGVTLGNNTSVISYAPANNDQVYCTLTSNEICPGIASVTSNTLVMGVNPVLPVAISIATSATSVCAGTPVTLNASPVNSGANPVYDWKVNGISVAVNAPSYTYSPNNGDSVRCILSSNALCAAGSPAMSNVIRLAVTQPVSMQVNISATANNNCAGTPVTLHATVINGGTNPTFNWRVNNNFVGPNLPDYTFVPVNGDNVVLQVTSSLTCITQPTVTTMPLLMNVNPVLPVSVSITPSANPVCTGSSVTISANAINQGSNPVYQWFVNNILVPGATSAYTFIPANGENIKCVLTSNAQCTSGNPAVSNTVVIGVNNMLYVGSIGSSQVSCANTAPGLLTATPPSNGFNPVYQWQRSFDNVNFSDIPGATGLTCQPDNVVDTLYYRQLQNASGTCGGPLPTNSVSVIVVPPVSVQLSIAMTTAGTIYLGAPASFVAYPVNGGDNPVFQWYVNGQPQQGSGNTFTYIPQNNDAVKCIMTSSVWCASGNPATSNTVMVPVSPDPLVPVAVTIVSLNPGPVCFGYLVSFKAIPGNGGLNPMFQWKVNGSAVGTNDSIFTYSPANGDNLTCTLTSSLPNVTGNPAISNTITAIVLPLKPVSVTVNTTSTTVCSGSMVTFVATPVNGGSNPVYVWKVNNIIRGNNSAMFSYVCENLDQVSCTLQSSEVCASPPSVNSNTLTIQVIPAKNVGITINPSENPVCAGSMVTFNATVTNQGTSPVYQWYVNGVSQGANAPVFNYTPINNDVVSCVLTSDEPCSINNPATSNAVTMNVNSVLPVSIAINASATTLCDGTSVLVTASPVNGGSNPVFQWFLNGQSAGTNAGSFMFNPQDHDSVYCVLTANGNCYSGNPARSNTIGFTVNPLVNTENVISASANQVCIGTTVTYTSVVTNGGSNPVYQWKVNGVQTGTNSPNLSYIPANNDNVTCIVTSTASCVAINSVTSNSILMMVYPKVTLYATVIALQNNVCAGTLVEFTCSTVNAGPNPVYQWKVNNVNVGTDTNKFSYVPQNSDQVKCMVTAIDQCLTNTGNKVTSNLITMKVNPVQVVTVNVTPSGNPVCDGANVTYSASVGNGGANPVFQWKVNGANVGTNVSTYNYVPDNGDQITCSVRSSVTCPSAPEVTSSPVVMVVQQLVPVGVSVNPSVNPSCAGSAVTFSAYPVNGGTTPLYQWKVNGGNVGNGSQTFNYIPAQGDNVVCVVTSSASCVFDNPAISAPVVMNVNPLVETSVTVTSSVNNVCFGTQVTFTASPVNGGNTPVYQWKVNGINVGTNGPGYSYIPVDHDTVSCLMYSSENCPAIKPVMSNKVAMTISSSPLADVSIQSVDTTLCNGASVVCTATPVNGGSNPSYQWLLNGNPVGSNSPTYSFTPAPGASLKCIMTSSLLCVTGSPATSDLIDFTVYNVTQASVTVSASPSGAVCQSSTVVYTASPVNGGSHPVYQWKLNGTNIAGATGSTYSYSPSNGNAISCVMTSDAPCVSGSPATSNTLTMTVNPSTPVSVAIGATHYAVMPSTPVKFYAKPVNGGSAPSYTWYVNTTQVATGATSHTYNPANNDNVKCVLTSSLPGCLSNNPATSNIVNMIVYSTGTACSGTPTVVYGGKTYNTVQIGTQCWMRENLNIGSMVSNTTTQSNNSVIEKYCYTNDTLYCNTYGGLYQWAEMVQYLNGVTNITHWSPLPTGNVQGICPTGWHVPSRTEGETLTAYLGNTVAGGRMKESSTVHWNSPNTGANNNVGFTALPAGHMYNSTFENLRMYTNMWTITQGYLTNAAIVFGAAYNSDDPLYGETFKTTGYSVRCIKN